jgi:hypothetical protein
MPVASRSFPSTHWQARRDGDGFERGVGLRSITASGSGFAVGRVAGTDGVVLLAVDVPGRSISLCGADGLPLRDRFGRSAVNAVPVGVPVDLWPDPEWAQCAGVNAQ